MPQIKGVVPKKTALTSDASHKFGGSSGHLFFGKIGSKFRGFYTFLGFYGLIQLPWQLSSRESACQCRRFRLDSWIRKIPWRRKW